MAASVTLASGVELTSATATQEALQDFAEANAAAAATKAQKVDAPPVGEDGAKTADSTPPAGAEPAADESGGTDETRRDDAGRFSKRAKSQDARAEDVPRIKELTRRLREAEARAQALEQRAAPQPPQAEAQPAPVAPTGGDIPAGFTEPEPTLAGSETYEGWLKDWTRWDRHREDFATKAQQRETQANTDGQKFIAEARSKFDAAANAFAESHPEYLDVDWSGVQVSPLLHAAILFDDKEGPRYSLALAKSESLVAELNLLAEGKPVNTSTVASMQRVLAARVGPAKSAQDSSPSITKARPPIKPVAGTPTVPEVPRTQLSTDDYLKLRLPELRSKRR
jgi:hypothetical protein